MMRYSNIESPNSRYRNPKDEVVFDVIHYTAGGSAMGTAAWFADTHSRVSAHEVFGRDGHIVSCVPATKKAWHAGVSNFTYKDKDYKSLNRHSFGYELANHGLLHHGGGGEFLYAQGRGELRPYRGLEPVWGSQIVQGVLIEGWFEPFPEAQLLALEHVLENRDRYYPNRVMVGHNEIAPGRKIDPGPAFPWERFKARRPERAEP